jgi:uncharacterized protein YjbI with pentapeptide repeats
MANPDHLAVARKGGDAWNQWLLSSNQPAKLANADLEGVDLSHANLMFADLSGANLHKTSLVGANLYCATLSGANLEGADLRSAMMTEAELSRTNLHDADLRYANLDGITAVQADFSKAWAERVNAREATFTGACLENASFSYSDLTASGLQNIKGQQAGFFQSTLRSTDFTGADLREAYFTNAILVGCRLSGADLTGANVHGASVWNVALDGAKQHELVITSDFEPRITTDDIELAQLIYLLLHAAKLRNVLDTLGRRGVLILGRFTPERKALLDAIRDELRRRLYLPILFDFPGPSSGSIHETIVTLAGLARFIVVDISDPKSVPQELTAIVPTRPSVPVVPLLQKNQIPWAMFGHIQMFPWVLPIRPYATIEEVVDHFDEYVVNPAEAKAAEQRRETPPDCGR